MREIEADNGTVPLFPVPGVDSILPRMSQKPDENDTPASTTRKSPKFDLRLPGDLRDRIDLESKRNHRSMNSEMVARLEDSLREQDSLYQLISQIQQSIESIERRLDEK